MLKPHSVVQFADIRLSCKPDAGHAFESSLRVSASTIARREVCFSEGAVDMIGAFQHVTWHE